MQRDIALHLDGADQEDTRGHQHRAPLVLITCVNRRLHRGGVERGAVALGAKVADVVGARAEIVVGCRMRLRSSSRMLRG